MNKNCQESGNKLSQIRGFSLVETIIVILLVAILAAVSIPELLQSRRAWRFAGMQQQLVASLRQARQIAMSQNRRIAFEYDDAAKTTRIYDIDARPFPANTIGFLGPINDPRNIVVNLTGESLSTNDIVYGALGTPPYMLDDTSSMTPLSGGPGGTATVFFSPRGDAVLNTPQPLPPAQPVPASPWNYALFFYNSNGNSSAFAISILGPGGRIRVWHYNGSDYE